MSVLSGSEDIVKRKITLDVLMSSSSEQSDDEEKSIECYPCHDGGELDNKQTDFSISGFDSHKVDNACQKKDITVFQSDKKNSIKSHPDMPHVYDIASEHEALTDFCDTKDSNDIKDSIENFTTCSSSDGCIKEKMEKSTFIIESSEVIAQNSKSSNDSMKVKSPLLAESKISTTSNYTAYSDSTLSVQIDSSTTNQTKPKNARHRNRHRQYKTSKDVKSKDDQEIGKGTSNYESRNVGTRKSRPKKNQSMGQDSSLRKTEEHLASGMFEPSTVQQKVEAKTGKVKHKKRASVLLEPSVHQDCHKCSTVKGQQKHTATRKESCSNGGSEKPVLCTKVIKQKSKNPEKYRHARNDGIKHPESKNPDLYNQTHQSGPSESVACASKQHYGSVRESNSEVKPMLSVGHQRKGASSKVQSMQLLVSETDIINLVEKINGMKIECESKYEREMIDLKKSESEVSKKNALEYGFDEILAEKQNIKKSKEECRLRKEALLEFYAELEEEIAEQLHSESQSLAEHAYKVLQHKFDRECQRYENALPIYARRTEILREVESHQTCVLIGETGSGKSTQLVQYLYEAGYAEHGIIACTQPRKLAARSLAEHVSKETGEQGKTTYAYYGSESRWKTGAKVLFMTDHTLLNECIADRRLSKYTVIVIDEAHERSIHTDILIALIKQCLPDRQDLRVIVTSATINPTTFSYYFGGPCDCPVIEVSGRIYPVELKWENKKCPTLERKYVEESVDLAYDIHLKNKGKDGDMLVFLTSPVEIEKACKLAQAAMKSEVTVLPLHGKLQPEEQQKVFEKTPGKRKVVFSTNVAETSVTIPGIKFVIDTGLSKEMCYDPQRNINSLEIRPISKSSADQRKGRAGRTGPGECHRLFSQHEYETMRDDSTPEILRITLSFAVIKLYEFGIDDVHSFEFVDAPDRKALDDAVKNLKFLGAIKDGKLTDIGRKMALLPLEPNLAKILLDSIDRGIGTIGAVAVAISSLAGQVFFRPSKEELKEESDQLRLPFCQDSGDQMTNLHTYFQWYNQSKKDRNDWCKENYVNGKSMQMVKELVEELVQILKQKSCVNISPTLESLDGADDTLPKLFFDAFLNNLCVHLGHDKVGYWCEKNPTEQLILHYGSSLHYLSSYPQCVVFERTHKTSQHFMLQILPVPEEWIISAIESGKLPYHPCQAPLYSHYKISCLTIPNLGPIVLSKLYVKYHPDRRNSVNEFTELDIQPFFEYCKEKGELKVFAQEVHHAKIKKSIHSFIEDIKNDLKSETNEEGLFDENDEVRVIMAEGGVIQHVLMPNDFRGIKVRGIRRHFKDIACKELQRYGECKLECGKCLQDGTIPLIIKFQDPSAASQALQHTFEGFSDPHVVIHRLYGSHRSDFSLKVSWVRRERRDYAYINLSEEQTKFVTLPSKRGRCSVWFQYTEGRKSIRVHGLRPEMDENFIKSKLLRHCPALTDINVHFLYSEAFDESQDSYFEQKLALQERISNIIPRNKYFTDFLIPSKKSTKYIAYVHFDDIEDCIEAEKELSMDYSVEISISSSVRYTPQVFSVIELSIQYLAKSVSGNVTYNKKDKWGNVLVKISAQNIDSFTEARDAVSRIAKPDVISCDEKEGKYASASAFQKTLKQIGAETKTLIKFQSLNLCSYTINIYGTTQGKEKAKMKLQEHLACLIAQDVNYFEVNLKKYSSGILRHLVVKFGLGAKNISDEFPGIRAAKLDSKKHILSLFSTYSSYEEVCKYLESYKSSSTASQRAAAASTQECSANSYCCMCYTIDATFYRLECCGHAYCKECIRMQFDPLSVKFPITCAAYQCEENFVWQDFKTLSQSNVIQLQDIKLSALKHFVSDNSSKYHHCTTPDCDMLYIISEKGERFICSQCGANICTCCHENWHEGYDSCVTYLAQNYLQVDTSVDHMGKVGGDYEKHQRRKRSLYSQSGTNSNYSHEHQDKEDDNYSAYHKDNTDQEDWLPVHKGYHEIQHEGMSAWCSQCGSYKCTCSYKRWGDFSDTNPTYHRNLRKDAIQEVQIGRDTVNHDRYPEQKRFLNTQRSPRTGANAGDTTENRMGRRERGCEAYQREETSVCTNCGAISCTCSGGKQQGSHGASCLHQRYTQGSGDRGINVECQEEPVCLQCGAKDCICHSAHAIALANEDWMKEDRENHKKSPQEEKACSKCKAKICICHFTHAKHTQVDNSLEEWMNEDRENRKKCPKCQIPIEKSGGGKNVLCIQCRTNICWVCLRYFDTASECIKHIDFRHGESSNRSRTNHHRQAEGGTSQTEKSSCIIL